MIIPIYESIQLIHIDGKKDVTPELVKHALVAAKACKNYAKFYTDKFYITVNFHKDNTMSVAHNIRNRDFYRELMRLQNNIKQQTNIQLYSIFIARWLNKIRRDIVW